MNCTIKGCTSRLKKGSLNNVTFHKFPMQSPLGNKWLEQIDLTNDVPNQYRIVCSLHFAKEDFVIENKTRHLMPLAIPNLNLSNGCNDSANVSTEIETIFLPCPSYSKSSSRCTSPIDIIKVVEDDDDTYDEIEYLNDWNSNNSEDLNAFERNNEGNNDDETESCNESQDKELINVLKNTVEPTDLFINNPSPITTSNTKKPLTISFQPNSTIINKFQLTCDNVHMDWLKNKELTCNTIKTNGYVSNQPRKIDQTPQNEVSPRSSDTSKTNTKVISCADTNLNSPIVTDKSTTQLNSTNDKSSVSCNKQKYSEFCQNTPLVQEDLIDSSKNNITRDSLYNKTINSTLRTGEKLVPKHFSIKESKQISDEDSIMDLKQKVKVLSQDNIKKCKNIKILQQKLRRKNLQYKKLTDTLTNFSKRFPEFEAALKESKCKPKKTSSTSEEHNDTSTDYLSMAIF